MAAHDRELDTVAHRYLAHLTDADRRMLATAEPRLAALLAASPAAVVDLMGHPAVTAALFTPSGRRDRALAAVSPFLAFAVAVHRTAADLATVSYVPEWTGPRQRVPVFAGAEMTAFLADPWHRLFLAELLASYAHVSSGSVLTRTTRGWRRRRFNELDPVQLAALLDVVPEDQRASVFRRLGDLALFLTGVFPDHTALHALRPLDTSRLLRLVGQAGDEDRDRSTVDLLQWLGRRWYRQAVARVRRPTTDTKVLTDMSRQFADARRVLTVVSDRYLFPAGNPWFAPWN